MNKRLIISLITGALLGIICIIGGGIRARGIAGNELYLAAMWYNRVIIGLVVGLAGSWQITHTTLNRYIRGALLGLMVSAAFFLSTGMRDVIAFIAGIVYGIIIEYVAYRFE
ncbi:MAG: hypothetical protein ACMUIU_11010 [bacterium]